MDPGQRRLQSPELREAVCGPEMETQGGEGMGWRQLEGSAETEERYGAGQRPTGDGEG